MVTKFPYQYISSSFFALFLACIPAHSIIIDGHYIGRYAQAQVQETDIYDTVKPANIDTGNATGAVSDYQTLELPPLIVQDKMDIGRDASAHTTVITGSQLRNSTRANTLEATSQHSSGVYVSSRGTGLHGVASGASGSISIRGLGGSPNTQILVVEDGAPDYQGIFGHPIPDAFSSALIDRVLVVKGGDGVLYGTNALGGALVIENRWPRHKGWEFNQETVYGSYNIFQDRSSLLFSANGIDAVGSFSAFTTDGHRDGTSGKNIMGQLRFRRQLPGGGSVSISERIVHLEGSDPGPIFHPTPGNWFDVTRNRIQGRMEYKRKHFRIQTASWFNSGEHHLYDGFHSRDYVGGANTEIEAPLFDNRVNMLLGTAVEMVNGETHNRINSETSELEGNSSIAGYGQTTIQAGYNMEFVGGIRAHYNSIYGFIPLYKTGIGWSPLKGLKLRTRLTSNFRQPTLKELYLPFPTANASLKPERAINWDLGVDGKWKSLAFSCAIYHTWVGNLIKYFGAWPSAEVVNIDRIEITGVDAHLEITDIGPLRLFTGISWQDVGRFTKQNPQSKANFSVEYQREGSHKCLIVAVSGEWVHGLYMNNYNRDPIKDVLFLDSALRLKLKKAGGIMCEPYFIIRNLLNQRYAYIKDYTMPNFNIMAGIRLGV